MTGRERIKAALTFSKPDRAPRDLWAIPYVLLFRRDELKFLLNKYPMDIGLSEISLNFSNEQLKLTERKGEYTDDWGSIWRVGEPGVWGEVIKPVLSDLSLFKKFKPPFHIFKNINWSDINKKCEQSEKFMLSHITARPFERLQFLRGTENLFMDIAYNTAEFQKLLKIVHEFYIEDIKGWCKSDVDGIFFMDDWGANSSLLINPKIWRELFKPLYKQYCDIIHNANKFTFFHSDGNIEEIFDDLIEIGIDAINSQLFTMDFEKIANNYKGKITFWGEIDRQHILAFGTAGDVYKAVMNIRHNFDNGNGGVIAQCEWGKDNSMENVDAVYAAWNEISI